jgi:hypothetical protein
MIRTDKDHQWASTQMAIQDATSSTPAKWALEEGRKQTGLDYQGRYPEAAHAASEIDEWTPMTTAQALAWWMPAIVPFAGIVALALGAVYFDQVSAWLLGWL